MQEMTKAAFELRQPDHISLALKGNSKLYSNLVSGHLRKALSSFHLCHKAVSSSIIYTNPNSRFGLA